MNEAQPQDIGIAIGALVAASLALQTALGPAMHGIVEAVKAAGLAPHGRAGLVSLGIGTVLGLLAGALAWAQGGDPVWVGVGALAGLVGLGAGGVRSHLVAEGLQAAAAKANPADAVPDRAVGAGPALAPVGISSPSGGGQHAA